MDRRSLLLSFAAGSVLAACAPRGAESVGGDSRTLNASIGLPEPHAMFAPGGGGSGPGFTGSKVLEKLIRRNADQSFAPVLATEWAFADGGKRLDLTLRQGVVWHDGKPLTADDVVWSATNYWKPFAAESLFGLLTAVEKTEKGVALIFERPVPEQGLLYLLGGATNYILPKHVYEGADLLLNPANNAPIGTGPWKFSKWVRGSHAEFVKNEAYWTPGRPKADKLVIRWFREPASRVAALETGQIDIAVNSPSALADLDRLKTNPNLVIQIEDDEAGGGSLYFNTRRPIFGDVRVRRALLHAIDRDFIARTVYAGHAIPAVSPIFSNNKLYFTPDVPKYPFDPVLAGRLLDEAGYPKKADGKRFKADLLASGWYEENGKVGLYLKQALGEIGVDVTLRNPDRANSLKALYADYDFDMAYSQAGGVSGEPLPTLGLIYGSAGIQKGLNFRNASRFSDPQTDALIEKIAVEVDPVARKQEIQDFARRVVDLAPVVPLAEVSPFLIRQKGVTIGDVGASVTTDSWGDIGKA